MKGEEVPQDSTLAVDALLFADPDGFTDNEPVDLTGPQTGADRIVEAFLLAATVFSGLVVTLVAVFVLQKGLPALSHSGLAFLTNGGWDGNLESAWEDTGNVIFGARPLIAGSLLSTLFALAFTLVLGTGSAIVITELAPGWLRRPVEAVVQLLAGVPSVVFGLVGFALVVPFVTDHVLPADAFDKVPNIPYDGQSLLAAVIVLTFMILPFFVSVASDSLRAVPSALSAGARALGITRWRTIARVQIPVALPGLMAGAVLAAARAIGEAIALSMVAGALALTPGFAHGPLYFALTPIRTMASAIVDTGGEAMSIPAIEGALFGLATLLLALSLCLSLLARWAYAWSAKKLNLTNDRDV